MNFLIWTFIFSLSPLGELRLSIPYGMANGGDLFIVFLVSVVGNILTIPLTFLFLTFIHQHLMKIKIYARLFNLYLERVRKQIEPKLSSWKYFALLLFVAIPLPGTGAYTASVAAWFFEFEKKKSFIVISLGVLCAGIIVMLTSLGVINGLKQFF